MDIPEEVNTEPCPGPECHSGDWADFDHFCDVNGIAMEDTGQAFAAWMHHRTGWDGDAERIK